MHKVYLLTGSNIGDRLIHLKHAAAQIEKQAGKIISASAVYETEPWGVAHQDAYMNQAIAIESTRTPIDLFIRLKEIEMDEGRTDQLKYAPRTLDIDILFYDEIILQSDLLTIPHPRLQLRKFVLIPLNEIAAKLIHPVLKKNMKELLDECSDPLQAKRIL